MDIIKLCAVLSIASLTLSQTAPPCNQNFTGNDVFDSITSPGYPQFYPIRSTCLYSIIFENPGVKYDINMYIANFRTYVYRSSRDSLIINNREYYGDGAVSRTALQIGQTYLFRGVDQFQLLFYATSGSSQQGFSIDFVTLESAAGSPDTVEGCEGVTCENGGTCHSHGPGDWFCYCRTGYLGDLCQFIPNTHDCPKTFNEDGNQITGEIRSTYYPSNYPNNHFCDFVIFNTTVGETFSFYVEDFITESGYDVLCVGDLVNCYSGDGRSSRNALRVGQTYTYPVTDTTFRLSFRTDRSRTYRGFRLSYALINTNQSIDITTPGRTNKGTEFTFAFLPHQQNSLSGDTQFYITCETPTAVTVFFSLTGQTTNYTVDPFTPLLIDVPSNIRTTEGLEQKGIRVTSDANVTVAAYSSTVGSADGFLVLPEVHLGTQHVVAAYTPSAGSYSYIIIVGLDNFTTAWIVPRNDSINEGDGGYDYDNALRIDLYDTQTYTYRSTRDLTGVKVVSDRPVAVISGCDYAQVPEGTEAGDQLVEMIPSVISLGYDFIVAPISERIGGEIVRVISWTDDTLVRLPESGFSNTIDEGQFTEILATSGSASFIQCNKKCLVVQYNKGYQRDGIGSDPFMAIIPPIQQYTQNNIFKIPTGFRSYVNVVIQTAHKDGLQLTGTNVSSIASFIEIPNSDYSYVQIPLNDDPEFLLTHSGGDQYEWYALLYGHSSISNTYRGYGYPLGMQLDPLEPPATEEPKETEPPVTAPPGNITERCRCNMRILGNMTAGEAEFATLVHDLPDINYFHPQVNCDACLSTLQRCPIDCRAAVLEQWGDSGLSSDIIVDTPNGPRTKAFGQLMCERHYVTIPPPGRKIGVFYRAGNCMPTPDDAALLIGAITGSGGPYLCCSEAEVPIVGTIPVWDPDCNGEPLYLQQENMLSSVADIYKLKGIPQNEIDNYIKEIRQN
ncbi:unnamed protein product [Owenia fusiformis]|uniref:Uncharacterized protein n=1 Tax=Owenia fusiformis TaxID=6347 RepID=A0A8S4N0E8_OWEFU|nr:unnamed protein product [Owenia fusiformis]